MSRNRLSLLALLVVSIFSANGMQIQKIKHNKHHVFMKFNDKAFKYDTKKFHTSKPLVNIKSLDKETVIKEHGKFLSVMAKMKPKPFYIDQKILDNPRILQNGAGGAWLGFAGGKALVYGVWNGVLWGVQVGGDLACPGLGTAASLTMYAVVTPLVIEPLSNVVAISGGIAVGTATGPV